MVKDFLSIGDSTVRRVAVRECHDPMVDLSELGFTIDHTRKQISNRSRHFSKVRSTVALKLRIAADRLPPHLGFLIKEGYRPAKRQMVSYENVKNHLRTTYPELTEGQVVEETDKLCAPIDVAPHPTGAAVDLTLRNVETGEELDLGTEYNAIPLETDNATFSDATNIGAEAAELRRILHSAMTSAAFVNYPSEWWHWSYGDKYWAATLNRPHALYGFVDEDSMER